MVLQTMSNRPRVPQELLVGRSDPVYMAHGYLTKVPVPAIIPFIEAYTKPGDMVVDPFAGSGMTGVAAAILGRRARLFDISILGRHIGSNYLNLVDADRLRSRASEVVRVAQQRLGDIYGVHCSGCGQRAELAKSVWSAVVRCDGCGADVNFYRSLERANWSKARMVCAQCSAPVTSRLPRMSEEPVVDYVNCACATRQIEQPSMSASRQPTLESIAYPRVEITPDRQMYQAQALGKSGRTTIASFYSPRNLAVLTALRDAIALVDEPEMRRKLLFALTATVTRASKRYQWSRQRPLNAANANYYVAAVFYEWNVYELFKRKIEAAARSDSWVSRQQALWRPLRHEDLDISYVVSSAEKIPLPDASVDYVFTDPPFGSNLFYADMALFQEAWLDNFTNAAQEAVIGRGARRKGSADRYERLLTRALAECRRVLKPGGHISMVFGNSTGAVWALAQRAIANAGLTIEPDELVVLDKGQRSVKGLASGFEHVATLDLIMTMRAVTEGELIAERVAAPTMAHANEDIMAASGSRSPSHLYLEMLRRGLREGWDLSRLDLRTVTETLRAAGWEVDEKRGLFTHGGI